MHSLALLMLLLCLAILYFALTTNLFFLYEASQSGHLETLRRRSGLTPALLFLKGFASCLGSQLVVCLLYPLGAIPGRDSFSARHRLFPFPRPTSLRSSLSMACTTMRAHG